MSEEELNQMSNNELIGIIKAQKFEIEQLENIRKEVIELIKKYQRKDEFLNLNEWQTRDLLNILNKGDNNVKD